MKVLDRVYGGNAVSAWLVALLIVAVTLATLIVLKRMAVRRLSVRARRTGADADELALDLVSRTRFFLLAALSVYAGVLVLDLPRIPGRLLGSLIAIAALLQLAVWGNGLIAHLIARYVKRAMAQDAAEATTVSAFGFVARLLLWTIILFLALGNLGVNITALVAGLGVGGVAVALALQNILGDLFASFSIVLDKPFVIGDFIIVDEYLGTVEHVGLKTTRIRSLSGEQVVFANSDLLKSRVRNLKRMAERRVVFTLGVTYGTPYEKLAMIPGVLREIIEAQHPTRFDRAHFREYGDFALKFEVVYYVLAPDYNAYMDIQQAINLDIYRRFEEEGIEFAYPTQTLYVSMGPPVAGTSGSQTLEPAGRAGSGTS